MKKNYVIPRTAVVAVNVENVMYSYSTAVTGGYDYHPRMGTDGEGEYGQCLNDFTDFS